MKIRFTSMQYMDINLYKFTSTNNLFHMCVCELNTIKKQKNVILKQTLYYNTYHTLTFFADSENNTPLLPIIPTGYPNILAKPKNKLMLPLKSINIYKMLKMLVYDTYLIF